MATAVHQPLSASSQSLYVHHNYINSGLIMPSNAPIAPLTTTPSAPLDPSKRSQQDATTLKPAGSSQTHSLSKKRRFSKGKIPAEIKRSASTPQMRSIAAVDGDSLSPTADKKRNKLGYHRTSVACGHCRRRKIRCLPAADDPQGRCSNCIRLKKECNFYPVDQESQHIQQKPSSSALKGPTASNPSSPRTIATSSHESIEDFNSYRSLPSNSANSRFVVSADHDASTASSGGGGAIFQPPSALPPHMNPYGDSLEDHWNPGFFAQPMGGETRYESQNSAYWRPHESEGTPAYGQDPKPPLGYSQTRIGSMSTLAYTTADDTQNWPAPARAMSYGHIESLAHHDYQDRAAAQFPHPHTLDTSAAITSTTISTPLSAPILGHGMPNYGYQQQWNSMYRAPATVPSDSLQGQAFAPQFYPGNAHSLQQMKEEHLPGATGQYAATQGFYQAPDPQAMR